LCVAHRQHLKLSVLQRVTYLRSTYLSKHQVSSGHQFGQLLSSKSFGVPRLPVEHVKILTRGPLLPPQRSYPRVNRPMASEINPRSCTFQFREPCQVLSANNTSGPVAYLYLLPVAVFRPATPPATNCHRGSSVPLGNNS
jgi:hypothetical protein